MNELAEAMFNVGEQFDESKERTDRKHIELIRNSNFPNHQKGRKCPVIQLMALITKL